MRRLALAGENTTLTSYSLPKRGRCGANLPASLAFTPIGPGHMDMVSCFNGLAATAPRRCLSRLTAACLVAGATVLAAGADAQAQVKMEAKYVATLAGLPIGKGTWVLTIGADQYSGQAVGGTAGLLNTFSKGSGASSVQGKIKAGEMQPASYAATIKSGKKTDQIQVQLNGGNVTDYRIVPETPPHPEQVPITDAAKRNVIDPMTGTLVRVKGNGNPLSAEACASQASVFDGRMRYDIRLTYKRMDVAKAEHGYQGPVVVCAITFVPVAGHIPSRYAIKYLAAQKDMEVWLAPIAGTRLMAPFRISVPTPVGQGVLHALSFVTAGSVQPVPASLKP